MADDGLSPRAAQFGQGPFDEVRRGRGVASGQGVRHGGLDLTVVRVPTAGAAVELGHLVGALAAQVCAQHVSEEVVVAEPPAMLVERDHEEVFALQQLEHRLPSTRFAGHRLAQRCGETLEDGGVEQEAADGVGLPGQDLVDEVVDDETVVPGEPVDEPGGAGTVPQGQRRELERGDPALGAALERRHRVGRQPQVVEAVEIGSGLVPVEAQLRRPDLGELTPGSQAGEGEHRVGPRDQDQVELGREVVDQEGHRPGDVGTVGEVVVVENQGEVPVIHTELVDHPGEHGGRVRLPGRPQGQCRTGRAGRDELERGEDVSEEPRQRSVAAVQGHPGDSPVRRPEPRRDEGALAEPSGC